MYTHPRPYVHHTYNTYMHCYSSTYVEKKIHTWRGAAAANDRTRANHLCLCVRAHAPNDHRVQVHTAPRMARPKKRSIVWVLYPAACFRKNFNFTNKNTQRVFFQNIVCTCTMKYVFIYMLKYIRIYLLVYERWCVCNVWWLGGCGVLCEFWMEAGARRTFGRTSFYNVLDNFFVFVLSIGRNKIMEVYEQYWI